MLLKVSRYQYPSHKKSNREMAMTGAQLRERGLAEEVNRESSRERQVRPDYANLMFPIVVATDA
ncbi:hypothetical protein SDC9_211291 [bioreactor metagenome]|uniref:Uncharacterized protein n=1 Tax=bioreactor metagenome TaxID=1076179 RepID=A0A645JJI8_9ZZZZ